MLQAGLHGVNTGSESTVILRLPDSISDSISDGLDCPPVDAGIKLENDISFTAGLPSVPPSFSRRLLDLIVSVLAVLAVSPLLLIVAIAVRAGSKGPVLFRQSRIGQGGAPFTMYKFRTMYEGFAGPGVTIVGDARITRLGALLRASSIDELPQLFNVLRGDMTLVGMRPESVSLAERYPPACQSLFSHRPGITGPSQVRLRDWLETGADAAETYYLDEALPRRVALDSEYLADPTLGRTLAILASTVPHVLKRMLSMMWVRGRHVPTPSAPQPVVQPPFVIILELGDSVDPTPGSHTPA